MKWLLMVWCILFSGMAWSGSHTVDLTLASYHFDREYDWNERNPGVIYRYYPKNDNKFFVTGGIFKNSYGDASFLLGVGQQYGITKNLAVGYNVGAVTGYKSKYNTSALPMITPYVTIADRINITYQVAGKLSSIGLSVRLAEWR
jgi:hypothetical protein